MNSCQEDQDQLVTNRKRVEMTTQSRSLSTPTAMARSVSTPTGTKNQTVKRSASRRVVFASVNTSINSPTPCLSHKRSVSTVVEDCQRKKKFYRDRKRRKAAHTKMMQRPEAPHLTNSVIMAAHCTPRDLPVCADVPSLSLDAFSGVNFNGSFLPRLTADDYQSLFSVVEA